MASISGTLQPGEVSPEFTPTELTSNFAISGGEGISIEAQAPGLPWMPVGVGGGLLAIDTPDTSVVYRFVNNGTQESDYYAGP